MTRFADYQNEIYLQGYGGVTPAFTTDATGLEASARARMDPEPFAYVSGGAGSGATTRANREAFDRTRLVPRMLADATERDLTTTVLGTDLPAPVLLAPVGVQSIVHPDAERATARAAASVGLPMVLSTMASTSIEDVAEAGDAAATAAGRTAAARWFQLYWPNDPDVCASLLDRAKRAGYTALVVTLDLWTLGWRPCDLDSAYLPFLRGEGTAIPMSDPVFRSKLDTTPEEDFAAAVLRWVFMITGTDRDWSALAFLREHWDGPIVLKGIQHVDDARRAVDAGMDGIVVSNHGGRQVDGAVASLDVLPGIATAVGDELAVLFDSGVRTGADVVKALALGARAVLLGRPYAYGLAHGGEDGVRHVLRGLLADLDLTMGLTGKRTLAELTPDILRA